MTARLGFGASETLDVQIKSGDRLFAAVVVRALEKWKLALDKRHTEVVVTVTFVLGGSPTKDPVTTVSGTSPLDLVVTTTPPLG